MGTEIIPDIKQINDAREQRSAPSRADGRVIEYASLLNDRGLVVVIRADASLLLLFGLEAEGAKGRHGEVLDSSVVYLVSFKCCCR